MALPASLSGYCAVVRTPLRLPTRDAAVPPAFAPQLRPRNGREGQILEWRAREDLRAFLGHIAGLA